MTHYRIYALSKGGHMLRGIDAECPDDAAAKAFALAGLGLGESREVWRGGQCIGFFIGPRSGAAIASRVTPAPGHRAGAVTGGLTHAERPLPPSDPTSVVPPTVILGHW